jgi:crotonobetainyl-CoA:carnitine CoA-transferase CaiB-like acyl-CoA transferase
MGSGWTSTLDGITLPASPIHVDGGAPPVRRPPPRLAEHQDAVLAEIAADQART